MLFLWRPGEGCQRRLSYSHDGSMLVRVALGSIGHFQGVQGRWAEWQHAFVSSRALAGRARTAVCVVCARERLCVCECLCVCGPGCPCLCVCECVWEIGEGECLRACGCRSVFCSIGPGAGEVMCGVFNDSCSSSERSSQLCDRTRFSHVGMSLASGVSP